MSHPDEREQKNCLNCGTTVIGKYCHNCGQANIEPKESTWHLVSHFFNDVTHFDGKVFTSMKDLIIKPGFLSAQYMMGKRASYLNPIRMYLFTSFIFFLVYFALNKPGNNAVNIDLDNNVNMVDSSDQKNLSATINNGKPLTREDLKNKAQFRGFSFVDGKYKSRAEFDSVESHSLKKTSWLGKLFIYKGIELDQKYHYNKKEAIENIGENIGHALPKLFFVLLPLFALVLKLLYLRKKDFYYTDHAIFTLHFYVFVFIDMLLIVLIDRMTALINAAWLSYLSFLLILALFFYLYKAMRNFYKQKRAITIVKYMALVASFSIILSVSFAVLALISFLEV